MLQVVFSMQPWTQLHTANLWDPARFSPTEKTHVSRTQIISLALAWSISLPRHSQVLRFDDMGFSANATRGGCLVRTDLQRRW